MKNNILLFGPPGIGKSTLIATLLKQGKRAIDLESLWPSKVRFKVPYVIEGTYIGMADLNPKIRYPNSIKVLLYMPQSAYNRRRAARDKSYTEKASQKYHNVEDWLTPDFDVVLDVDHGIDETISMLEKLAE